MTPDLRDLMHRVADDVEPVSVAPDTWQRARRARAGERLVVSALVTVLVLAGVAIGLRPSLLPGALEPVDRPAVGEAGAVPDVIYRLPDGFDEPLNPEWSKRPESVDVVQRASVALFDSFEGSVVLVSADDGEHHLVTLPGFIATSAASADGTPRLAVSPDGTKLAYAWRTNERTSGKRWPSGVAVLHLDEPGRTDVYRLPGADGVLASGFSWSPDGRWLAYHVDEITRMREDGFRYGASRTERLDAVSGDRVVLGRSSQRALPSVSDAGVVLRTDRGLDVWRDGRRIAVDTGDALVRSYGPSAWSPDGRHAAVAAVGDVDVLDVLDVKSLDTDDMEFDTPAPTTVLGWVGPDHVLLTRHVVPFDRTDLVLLDVRDGSNRTVGAAATGDEDTLSIATGLMTVERPTVDFAPPSWLPPGRPWQGWIEIVGGLALVGGLVFAWRRARRRDRESSAVPWS